MLLEHGGGRTVSVGGLGWSSNSSKSAGGLAEEGFGSIITGRLLLPSRCGKVGGETREATLLWGSSSTTEGVGCKILPTWTSSFHLCSTVRP